MSDEVPAAIRYKELTSLATTAAERLRRRENTRAAELEDTVATSQQRTERADEQLEQVRTDARKRWNAALELLFNERWMRTGEMPAADTEAVAVGPEQARQSMQEALVALHRALARPTPWWKPGAAKRSRGQDPGGSDPGASGSDGSGMGESGTS